MKAMLFALLSSLSLHAATPPNLIWIMADDLGYGELGCYGQKMIASPHIDRMAQEGMRFTHYYSGATVCAPSRSVLMTGQHQGHTRIRGNGDAKKIRLLAEDPSVAKILKSAGYRTAVLGKWGLGEYGGAESGLPAAQGFDEFFGYLNHQHAHNHFPDFLWDQEEKKSLKNIVTPVGVGGSGYATKAVEFADDLFTERALQFVEKNQKQPFFLYWSMVTPHANNERARVLGDGAHVPDYGPYAKKPWPAQDRGHAAMISRLDGYVGQLLEKLRALGIAENTLVIFTSDNGPHNESRHQLDRFQPSGPYRGIKRSLTDGGIRIPFIAWWPGTVKAASTSDHVGSFADWLPTAAELAGTKPDKPTDGISIAPTLRGKKQAKHEFLYWEFHEGGFQQAALYLGRWKGIRRGRADAPIVLYDQQNDPGESTNVASQHPDVCAAIDQYLRQARTPLPEWKPRWKP
jgi:arylsulfatase A-like enzyme